MYTCIPSYCWMQCYNIMKKLILLLSYFIKNQTYAHKNIYNKEQRNIAGRRLK